MAWCGGLVHGARYGHTHYTPFTNYAVRGFRKALVYVAAGFH